MFSIYFLISFTLTFAPLSTFLISSVFHRHSKGTDFSPTRMKTFANIRFMSVAMGLVVLVVTVWDVVLDAHKMSSVVNTWVSEGPHTSLMGKVREHLAAAWWLGPLKVSSAREPLVECSVSVGGGWRDVLPLMVGLKARLACLESHIQLAQEEHEAFITKFVMTVCCLVLVAVLGALLAWCCWPRNILVKEADCHLETHTCLKPVRCESCPLERCVIVMIYEVMTRDGLMTRNGRYVHFNDNILDDGHVTGTLALPASGVTVNDDSVVTVEDLLPMDDTVVTVEDTVVPVKDTVVTLEDTVVPVEDTVVPVDETAVTVEYIVVPVEDTVVQIEDIVVQVEELVVPVEDTVVPVEDTFVPVEDTVVPVEDTVVPVEDTVIPVEDTVVPVEDTVVPVEDTVIPVEDTVVPVEDTVVPVEDTVVPVEDTMIPVENTVFPVKDTLISVENTVVPVEDTVVPVDYVRRSLLVPRRFRGRLTEANDCLLESMQDQYSVTLLEDAARGKLHIKGTKDNVLQCYAQLKALIADWRARETSEV